MAKLYPPIISGTLPAFYLDDSNLDRMIKISVPFTMNRSVGAAQVKGFALKIKTVQNSEYLYTVSTYDKVQFNLEGSSYVNFILKTSNNSEERELILKTLKVGLFYKIQIAYIDQDNEIGNFSSVGVAKYTTKPEVYIKNLNVNSTNNHIYNYVGVYSQEGKDITEKVYNYCFNLYDGNDNLIASTGEQVHNATFDTDLDSSYDEFNYMHDFEIYKPYKIEYIIQTNNNLTIKSPLYRISQKITIDSDLKANIIATQNFSDGYILIDLLGHKDSQGNETITTGSFILSRASETDGYTNWEKLSTFKLIAEFPSRHLWKDFTAEQGKKYRYSLQQYNDEGLYSSRIISNEVFSDFEDAFLYDGERQLKIRFNPKLGNLKTNLSETKVDTLGSKYPFFFKNSEINYKEFTIAGLLSYLEDDNFFFISKEELLLEEEKYRKETKAIDNIYDEVSKNVARERLFKIKVLEWLNNGKPKLFRSPHEGNFIVRLMKVTLNPENKLGRLLHTFNCTAYEVDEYNYDNLIKYNFTHIIDNTDITFLSWKTINFTDRDQNGYIVYPYNQILNNYPTNNIKIIGMRPGQMISLTFENKQTELIMIGATGSYSLDSKIAIREIRLLESNMTYTNGVFDPYLSGSLTYSYAGLTPNTFNKVSHIQNVSYPARTFIGECEDILRAITCVNYNGEWLENPKQQLLKIFNIKCKKRDIELVTSSEEQYYYEQTGVLYDIEKANRASLMGIVEYTEKFPHYSPTRYDSYCELLSYYDLYYNKDITLEEYNPTICVNGNVINVEDSLEFEFTLEELKSLSCGNGVIVEISYIIKQIDFRIEDNSSYPDVYYAKLDYLKAKNKLDRYYEITGILGEYAGSIAQAQYYLNLMEEQLQQENSSQVDAYTQQKTNIEKNFSDAEKIHDEAHINMREYLVTRINELESHPIDSEAYRNELRQYREALYVEDYEYERLKQIRLNEKNKQINLLDAKISQIQTNIASEIQALREQYNLQLATITAKKEKVLIEINNDYNIENIDTQMDEWYNLRDSLIQEERRLYAAYINGLIISQTIELEEEQSNVE